MVKNGLFYSVGGYKSTALIVIYTKMFVIPWSLIIGQDTEVINW